MLQRTPNKANWKGLHNINKMTPQEFLQHWNVTYKELAAICHCSEVTVKRWFSTSSKVHPTEPHKALLAFTHKKWTERTSDDSQNLYQWGAYQRAVSKKQA